MTWPHTDFRVAFQTVSDRGMRVKQREYLAEGALAVVDQGEAHVGGYTDNMAMKVEAGGPVIVFGDHTRRVKYVDFDFAVGADGVKLLKPSDHLDPKFAFWFLQSVRLPDRGYGRHFALLRQTQVPVPPLDVQHRIVDLLEDHLSRLTAAEAYLDTALRRAEMLRWGSVAEAVSTAGGREVRLGDIASVRNGIFVSRPGSEPNGVPILRIGAVRSLSLDLSDLRYSERTEDDLRESDGLAQPGDLLFTRYNGNPRFVGACAAVPKDAPILTYPDKLIRVRVTDDAALSEFVALACSVGAARAEIQASVRTTAGQAGIAGRDLKKVTVTVPDLEAQRAAIRAATESGFAASRLSHELEIAQRRAAALRRSLLAAAFSGRLTSAESDLSAAEEMINT